MAVSMEWVRDPKNIEKVLDLYLGHPDKPTYQTIADRLGTRWHNVGYVINHNVDPERKKFEKTLRYSRSKMGERNPMLHKSGSLHHNYVGDIFTKDGYLQRKVNGRYELVHRLLMAEALGLEKLPKGWDVHHIDEDKTNNVLDNFALVTPAGHGALHHRVPRSEKLPIWVQWEVGTSKSKKTTRTLHKGS